MLEFLWKLPRRVLIGLVWVYQKTLSPDHSWLRGLFPGGYCKFTPSCSDYARATLEKDGAIKGSVKAAWRILRCNPWSKGGKDLP